MHPFQIVTFIVTMVFTMMMALAVSPPKEGALRSRPVPSTPVMNVPVPSNVHAGGVDAAPFGEISLVKFMVKHILKVHNNDINTALVQEADNSAQAHQAPSVKSPHHGGPAILIIQRVKDQLLPHIPKLVKSLVIANFVMRVLHIVSTPLFAHGQPWFNLYRESKVAAIRCLLFHPNPPMAYLVMLHTLTFSFFMFSSTVIRITLALTALLVLVMIFAADESPTEPTAEPTASIEDLEDEDDIFTQHADDSLSSEYFSTASDQGHCDVQIKGPGDNQQLILHPSAIRDWLSDIDIEILDDDDEVPIAMSEAEQEEQENNTFNSGVILDDPSGVEETIVAPMVLNDISCDEERAEVPTFKRYNPRLYVDTVDPDAWIADMLDSDDEDDDDDIDDDVEPTHCSCHQAPRAPTPASSICEDEQEYTLGLLLLGAIFTLLHGNNYTQEDNYPLQAHIQELDEQSNVSEEATATIEQTIDQPIPQTIVIEHPDGFFGRIDCSMDLDDFGNTSHPSPLPTSPPHPMRTIDMATHHNFQTSAEQPPGREYQSTKPSIRPTAQGRVGGVVNDSGPHSASQPMAARSRSSPRHSDPSGPSLLPIFFPHRFVKTGTGFVDKNIFGPIIEDP